MDAQYSGVPEYTFNLVKEILRLDTKNQYKLFYNSGRNISQRMPEFSQANAELIHTHYPNKIFNNIMQRLVRTPKIDRLLGVDLFFMPNIGFISLSDQCRKIITVHDLSFLRYPEFYSIKRRLWHKIINVKQILNSFDSIVAISQNTKQDLIELCGIENRKIKVIHNGISSQFQPISDQKKLDFTRQKYKLPDKFILTLSTIEPRKNIEGVIRGFSKCLKEKMISNDYELVVAGARGWKSRSIYKIWQNSINRDKIKFLGYIDPLDKACLYNLAELFIYPSFYEGFGFPPLEAAACETPVIASSVSSLPEIIGDTAVMVNPFNYNEISQAIEQVLSIKNMGAGKANNSAIFLNKKYNWQSAANDYVGLFRG